MIPKFVSKVILIIVVLLINSSISSQVVQPTRINITAIEKIQLLLIDLANAINEPSVLNIVMLEGSVPQYKSTEILEKTKQINSLLTSPNSKSLSLSGMTKSIQLFPGEFFKTGDNITSEVIIHNYFGQNLIVDTISLGFKVNNFETKLNDLDFALSKISEKINKNNEIAKSIPNLKEITLPTKTTSVETTFSPNLLIPTNIYGNFHTFNKVIANDSLDSDVFSAPYDVASIVSTVKNDTIDHAFDVKFFMTTDVNWDRIVGISTANTSSSNKWIGSLGSNGDDVDKFNNPSGIDVVDYTWIVADKYNRRALLYFFGGSSSSASHLKTIDNNNNFGEISDVAAARFGPDVINQNTRFAVLDKDKGKVHLYDYGGNQINTFCETGTTARNLNKPTSLCFGRTPSTGYHTPVIYVADNGNKRIAFININYFAYDSVGFKTTPQNMFPENAYLTSISVGPFGYVYVLDNYNGKVYKLDPALTEIIATYGDIGIGDGLFNYPNTLNFIYGFEADTYEDPDYPVLYSDMFITEKYNSQTGIKRFLAGNDILSSNSYYVSQPLNGSQDRIVCEWYQTGVTDAIIEVYYNPVGNIPGFEIYDTLIATINNTLNLPGKQNFAYWLNSSDADGYYKFVVNVNSRSGTTDTTFTTDLEISRDTTTIPCSNYLKFVDGKSYSIIDIDRPVGPPCYYADNQKLWKLQVYPLQLECNSTRYFYWDFGIFYNNEHPNGATRFTTTEPYVYINLQTWSSYDTLVAYVSNQNGPYSYNFPFNDTAICVIGSVAPDYCATACTTCYVPPPSCPYLYSYTESGYEFINNILSQSELNLQDSTDFIDYIPIYTPYLTENNEYKFQIKETQNEISSIDYVKAYYIDIPITERNLLFDKAEQNFGLLRLEKVLPQSAVTNTGIDIFNKIHYQDDKSFSSSSAGYIDVGYFLGDKGTNDNQSTNVAPGGGVLLPPPDKGIDKLAVIDKPFLPNLFQVYVQTGQEQYTLIDTIPPQEGNLQKVIRLTDFLDTKGVLNLRFEWEKDVEINSLPYYEYDYPAMTPQSLHMLSAVHSDSGDVMSIVDSNTTERVMISPGQNVEFTFEGIPVPDSMMRLIYLEIQGRYENLWYLNSKNQDILPNDYNFKQNYPNPFNPSTTFEFDLPKRTKVILEIFNVLGQKVKTVIDSKLEAGTHVMAWNGVDNSGKKISSGVYFAKFSAGEYKTTKKMVVLK